VRRFVDGLLVRWAEAAMRWLCPDDAFDFGGEDW
jgi:hypothetical protein